MAHSAACSRRHLLHVGAGAAVGAVFGAHAAHAGDADGTLSYALRPGTWADLREGAAPVALSAVLPATPQRVFATLVDPEPWPRWLSMVQAVVYRSEARGVGCERDVTVGTGDVIREHFIAWEPGARLTFYVTHSTSPLPSLFMEDYLLLPVAGGATRLRWTVQMALHAPASLLTPVAKAYFASQAKAGLSSLAALLSWAPQVR